MSTVMYSSKEEIRNRIIKKAQEIWGIDKVYDFDPLVVLIMEALSGEIFNITNEVNNLENRIFDKISRILAADNLVAPLPAHGIVQIHSQEDAAQITPQLHMFHKRKLGQIAGSTQDKLVEMDFSPLHTGKLFYGKLRYMATSQSLFEILPNQKKTIARSVRPAQPHTIYLGIEYLGENRKKAFDGLNFFFDWGNYQVSRDTYTLMALSKWQFNGSPVRVFRDRFMEEAMDREQLDDQLYERKHFMNNLKQDIEAYYHHRFLTLDSLADEDWDGPSTATQELKQIFDPSVLDRIDTHLEWIRIDVPAAIDYRLLEELNIHLNAFPVVNKRLVQYKNHLKILRNVVPIRTEDQEQLLTVDHMLDREGVPYSEIPYRSDLPSAEAGYYTIRHGSVERMDARSAKDMVDYLFELIRDEKAAFTNYDADFLNVILKDLDKNMALVQQKSKQRNNNVRELQNYIIVNPKNESDLMFLSVWVTYAELANGIGVGSVLQPRRVGYMTNEPILFLTGTTGGRSRLGRTDSVQAFKYGITTSDKIVSKNDIINFVKYSIGNKIKRVYLKSGVQIDLSTQRGFYKTLDIHLEADPKSGLTKEDWDELMEQTLVNLKVRSTLETQYRFILEDL